MSTASSFYLTDPDRIRPDCGYLDCTLTIPKNKYGDTLPLISNAEACGRVDKLRYQQKVEARVVERAGDGDQAVPDILVWLEATPEVEITPNRTLTDASGLATFTIERWEKPTGTKVHVELHTQLDEDPAKPSAQIDLDLKEAWYEHTFVLTVYYTPVEEDPEFEDDALKDASGLDEPHRAGWLTQVNVQGSGVFHRPDGSEQWVGLTKKGYKYQPGGGAHLVRLGHSVAVDRKYAPVIPYMGWIEMTDTCQDRDLGRRHACDVGGTRIVGYHIDVYGGKGQEERDASMNLVSKAAAIKWLGIMDTSCPVPR